MVSKHAYQIVDQTKLDLQDANINENPRETRNCHILSFVQTFLLCVLTFFIIYRELAPSVNPSLSHTEPKSQLPLSSIQLETTRFEKLEKSVSTLLKISDSLYSKIDSIEKNINHIQQSAVAKSDPSASLTAAFATPSMISTLRPTHCPSIISTLRPTHFPSKADTTRSAEKIATSPTEPDETTDGTRLPSSTPISFNEIMEIPEHPHSEYEDTLDSICMKALYFFNREFSNLFGNRPLVTMVNGEEVAIFLIGYHTFIDRRKHTDQLIKAMGVTATWVDWIGDEENNKKNSALQKACWPSQDWSRDGGYKHWNTLSHWSIFMWIEEFHIKHALVLEDDSVLNPNEPIEPHQFLLYLHYTVSNLPADYQIAWAGLGDGGHYVGPGLSNATNVYRAGGHRCIPTASEEERSCQCRRGMHAYLISETGAHMYLEEQRKKEGDIHNSYMGNEVQWILGKKCFWIEPPLFYEGSKMYDDEGNRIIGYRHGRRQIGSSWII